MPGRLNFRRPCREQVRARFLHNVALFFGSPGPAADLAPAREGFSAALAHFDEHEESGWHASVLTTSARPCPAAAA
jgi:hypothetical protein